MRAEPSTPKLDGVGALILHGFTSTTASMAPLAESVSQAGFAVDVPLLPGHGTSVDDLAHTDADTIIDSVYAAHRRLAQHCHTVVPVGLSMGGALALSTAAIHGSPAVITINPGLRLAPGRALAARALQRVLPTVAPVASDIARPGVVEEAYPATPLGGVVQLHRIFEAARAVLPTLAEQGTEVLLLRSAVDNVVGSASATLLKRALQSQVHEVMLRRSRHVATLDYDAELLQRRTVEVLYRQNNASAAQ